MALLADISLSTEAISIMALLVAALTGAVAMLFRQLIASKDAQLVQAVAVYVEQVRSYKEIAREATKSLTAVAAAKAAVEGRQIPPAVAPVVPEHSSPVTPEQKAAAELQTMRAQLTAATLELGLPIRTESDNGAEQATVTTPTVVNVAPAPDGPLTVVVNPDGGSPLAIQAEAVSISVATPAQLQPGAENEP